MPTEIRFKCGSRSAEIYSANDGYSQLWETRAFLRHDISLLGNMTLDPGFRPGLKDCRTGKYSIPR